MIIYLLIGLTTVSLYYYAMLNQGADDYISAPWFNYSKFVLLCR